MSGGFTWLPVRDQVNSFYPGPTKMGLLKIVSMANGCRVVISCAIFQKRTPHKTELPYFFLCLLFEGSLKAIKRVVMVLGLHGTLLGKCGHLGVVYEANVLFGCFFFMVHWAEVPL